MHSAVLHGKRVAVKVRHPGVAEQIELDFRLMRKVGVGWPVDCWLIDRFVVLCMEFGVGWVGRGSLA